MSTQFILQMSLARKKILSGNYVYPTELIRLWRTRHFEERLEERGVGIDCIPKNVRVTKDNIYCADTEGNEFTSVVVRLNYNSKFMFLCFNVKTGNLKTVWFKNKPQKLW